MPERLANGFFLGLGDEDLAVRPVPGRDLVAPPELARNAPGLDVFHPVEIGLLPVLGHELVRPSRTASMAGFGKRLGVDVPLVGQERLDRHAPSGRHAAPMWTWSSICSRRPRSSIICDDPFARFEAVEASSAAIVAVSSSLGGTPARNSSLSASVIFASTSKMLICAQLVALADLEVVEVVRRRDLHRARARLGIGVVVGNDRDVAADQRQDDMLADQVLVALVVRVHRDGGVAEHRLGPRRGDDDVVRSSNLALERIAEVPHMALDLDLLDLEVGDRGLEPGSQLTSRLSR